MAKRKEPIDALRDMLGAERISTNAEEVLGRIEGVRDLADALETLADAIEEAEGNISTWRDTEGREDKADAKVDALTSIEEVCDAADEIRDLGLPDWLTDLFGGLDGG